jgi:hypothetical protein
MIYFTEITKADGNGAENIAFQFFSKELPESIPLMYSTKINRIEYNGGFITNQIIGTFQQPIEWEGCFFGKYTDKGGQVISAKERAEEIKKFMGRPIRVGFPPPSDDLSQPKDDANLGGTRGVYIIEEYDMNVRNYVDIDYRIKLVPHMRQEKIRPLESDVIIVNVEPEKISAAAGNANKAAGGSKKPALAKGKKAATDSSKVIPKGNKPFNVVEHNRLIAEVRSGDPKRAAAANKLLKEYGW